MDSVNENDDNGNDNDDGWSRQWLMESHDHDVWYVVICIFILIFTYVYICMSKFDIYLKV